MKQSTTIRQTTHLAPQQILVAKLVQATGEELEQLITAETEKNLALEVVDENQKGADEPASGDEDYDFGDGSADDEKDTDDNTAMTSDEDDRDSSLLYSDDDEEDYGSSSAEGDSAYSPLLNYKEDASFREELLEQLNVMDLDEEDLFLARFLVNSLDDNGYLTRSISELVDDLAFTQMHETTEEKLTEVLTDVIQSLEPTGIGARNLQECLLLQLQEKKAQPAALLAYNIVQDAFEDLSARRLERLTQRFKVSNAQLADAMKVISHLDPKPGGRSSSDIAEVRATHVTPDFSIHNEDGELTVSVNDKHIPSVRISADYQIMLERIAQSGSKNEDSKQGLSMIRESISSGNLFIDALRQRRETMVRVIQVIAMMQRDYFLFGGNPNDLRPMVLQEVADKTGYDVSTISRVSNNKYIETDFGVIAMKDLFSTAIRTSNGDISNVAVQEALKELIEHEDKRNPLSDDALSELLKEKNFPIARRTVAKYRELLNYPTARLRREI
ncbi:MAG: RNA polymerase factor sigma-54 [Bacteroidales bacterium]|nr:RNA polymerase factor sigma-54 [Bacteroidales bacterium]